MKLCVRAIQIMGKCILLAVCKVNVLGREPESFALILRLFSSFLGI